MLKKSGDLGKITITSLVCLFMLSVTALCSASDSSKVYSSVDAGRIIQGSQEDWLSHGRTYSEQRFSPLAEINDKNVARTGLAWSFDFDTTRGVRGIEATPLVADGVMYVSASWSVVHALDARTGKLIWTYDPKASGAWARKVCCDVVNRGVALWGDNVYVGTIDGRLIAIDRKHGERVWEVKTVPDTVPYSITGAPRVVNGNVIIGNGGAEYGVRGYITAYDAETGKQQWRFYTVPGNPEYKYENPILETAAKTWRGEWWKDGGGGTVWDSMAYDPELNILYIGVGNGSPWDREVRSPGGGDNLFLSSIVALNPDDGSYIWHYQTTPGDTWDYTAVQQMILADLEIKGKHRKVIMQAPKNGFFYVLDRETGELLSADNYVEINWATHVDLKTGRPVETADARYLGASRLGIPGPAGGHNWHPMAYNPYTNLVYIPAQQAPFVYEQLKKYEREEGFWNTGVEFEKIYFPDDGGKSVQDGKNAHTGHLLAWDPVGQKEVWRVQHAGPHNGGALTTAGNLVFQGTSKGVFYAYSADKGRVLWSYVTQTAIMAAPISYEIEGEQYIAVAAGWGGNFGLYSGELSFKPHKKIAKPRLFVFKMDANNSFETVTLAEQKMERPPVLQESESKYLKGQALYSKYCVVCHGMNVVSSSGIPDLRYSIARVNYAWDEIVRKGILAPRGMASFAEVIDKDEAQAIKHYVVKRAWIEYENAKKKMIRGFFE